MFSSGIFPTDSRYLELLLSGAYVACIFRGVRTEKKVDRVLTEIFIFRSSEMPFPTFSGDSFINQNVEKQRWIFSNLCKLLLCQPL